MRQHSESNPLLAAEPAMAYATKDLVQEVISFDGLKPLKVSGKFLDEVVSITGLSVLELAEILEISKPNYYRKRQDSSLDLKTIDKLSSLLRLFVQGVEAFGNLPDFNRWLTQENLHLGNIPPKVFLKTERGRARLHQALGRIEHGIYG
jgi:uncharacterized protein (DUF2384 family)